MAEGQQTEPAQAMSSVPLAQGSLLPLLSAHHQQWEQGRDHGREGVASAPWLWDPPSV